MPKPQPPHLRKRIVDMARGRDRSSTAERTTSNWAHTWDRAKTVSRTNQITRAANHTGQQSTRTPRVYQTQCSRNQPQRYWTSERCQQTAIRPKAWDCQNQKGNSQSDRCTNLTRNAGARRARHTNQTGSPTGKRAKNTGRERQSSVSRTSEEPRARYNVPKESAVWVDKY